VTEPQDASDIEQ